MREEQSKQTIAVMETEVEKLGQLVEEGEALRRSEGMSIRELVALKKHLAHSNEKLASDNELYTHKFTLLKIELQELADDKKKVDEHLNQLQLQLMVAIYLLIKLLRRSAYILLLLLLIDTIEKTGRA